MFCSLLNGGKLSHGEHIYRYVSEDDFGRPEAAFNICTFWYIDALAAIGKREEACKLFNNMYDSMQEPCWLIVQGYQPEHR